jgi:hypothetical protein
MNLEVGKMRWQQGTLYLKPPGKFQFSPLYEFPEIVGNAEVDYTCNMLTVNETIERFTKQKQSQIRLSLGIGTYFKLLKIGWQVV